MSEQETSFQGWAIVEVMGHRAYAGHVSTFTVGSAGMLRIDVPETEHSRLLQRNAGSRPAAAACPAW